MSNKKSKKNWKDQAQSLIKIIQDLLKVIAEEHEIPHEDLNKLFDEYLRKSRNKKTSEG
jgi:hypothetical protein